jgi:hypothetical protein
MFGLAFCVALLVPEKDVYPNRLANAVTIGLGLVTQFFWLPMLIGAIQFSVHSEPESEKRS